MTSLASILLFPLTPKGTPENFAGDQTRDGKIRSQHAKCSGRQETRFGKDRETNQPANTDGGGHLNIAVHLSSDQTDQGEEAPHDRDTIDQLKIEEWRWKGDMLELRISRSDGELVWMAESEVHDQAEEALLTYWAAINGRPVNQTHPDKFYVHAILGHLKRGRKSRVKVQWVGYGKNEATWEPRGRISAAAPDILSLYWAEHGIPSRRKDRRGRPRWNP